MITVLDRQNIFDIAVIGAGTAEASYAIAYANNKSVSDQLSAGTEINIDVVTDKRTVKFFKTEIKPATGNTVSEGIFDETFDNTFE